MNNTFIFSIVAGTVILLGGGVFWFLYEREGRGVEDIDISSVVNDVAVESIMHVVPLEESQQDDAPQSDVSDVAFEMKESVLIEDVSVPFVPQSPTGNWSDPRQQDGCEEASVLMAIRWAGKHSITDPLGELNTISRAMEEEIGTFHDTSLGDTFSFVQDAIDPDSVMLLEEVTPEMMIDILSQGKIFVVATNGRLLGNPHFTTPGPKYHMLVVRGYDVATDEFITNDPGTRFGEGYRYPKNILFSAIQDYETGFHGTIFPLKKSAIVFSR